MIIYIILFVCVINWVIVSALEPSEFRKITRLIVIIPPFGIVLAIIGGIVVTSIFIKDVFLGLINFVKG
jgi:hypothetical protein